MKSAPHLGDIFEVQGSPVERDTSSGLELERTFRGKASYFDAWPLRGLLVKGARLPDILKYAEWTISSVSRSPLSSSDWAEVRLVFTPPIVSFTTAAGGIVEDAGSPEWDMEPGSVRVTRSFSGSESALRDPTWMPFGATPADMTDVRVVKKVIRRKDRGPNAIATVTLSNAISAASGITPGSTLEIDWQEGTEKIYKHEEFVGLTYDQLVEVSDFVEGDISTFASVADDPNDDYDRAQQKKLARLLIAGIDTMSVFSPVIRLTQPLDGHPQRDTVDDTLISGVDAGLWEDPPVRIASRPGSPEWQWLRAVDRLVCADGQQWQRISEWRGHREPLAVSGVPLEDIV